MEESWKTIAGYPNYSVSNLGRVRNNKTGRILRQTKRKKDSNYLHVKLYQGTYTLRKSFNIHRLVAEAFIPNPEHKPQVNHIDGNCFNNAVSNLEWVSSIENMTHSYYVLHNKMGCCFNPIKVIRVEDNHIFNSLNEAARENGLKSIRGIQSCLKGTQHTAGGYHWKYYKQ